MYNSDSKGYRIVRGPNYFGKLRGYRVIGNVWDRDDRVLTFFRARSRSIQETGLDVDYQINNGETPNKFENTGENILLPSLSEENSDWSYDDQDDDDEIDRATRHNESRLGVVGPNGRLNTDGPFLDDKPKEKKYKYAWQKRNDEAAGSKVKFERRSPQK